MKHKRARLLSGNGLRKRSPYIRRRAPPCPLRLFGQFFFLLDAFRAFIKKKNRGGLL
jgi:hypothetical protein